MNFNVNKCLCFSLRTAISRCLSHLASGGFTIEEPSRMFRNFLVIKVLVDVGEVHIIDYKTCRDEGVLFLISLYNDSFPRDFEPLREWCLSALWENKGVASSKSPSSTLRVPWLCPWVTYCVRETSPYIPYTTFFSSFILASHPSIYFFPDFISRLFALEKTSHQLLQWVD